MRIENNQILQEIKDMRTTDIAHQIRSEKFFSVTETKLQSIDDRLNILNSKVATNVNRIHELEKFKSESAGKMTMIGAVAGIIFSTGASLVFNILK